MQQGTNLILFFFFSIKPFQGASITFIGSLGQQIII